MTTEEGMATKSVSAKKKSVKKMTGAKKAVNTKHGSDVPSLFRLNVEVGDLDKAADFYGKLFGVAGRKQAGSRCYFTCGPVTLQVVDVSAAGPAHPLPKALYFTVNDLDAVHARA